MRTSFPQVTVELNEFPRDEQIARVDRRGIDIGIVRVFSELELPPQMESLSIQREGMVLAMRRDHPLASLERALSLSDLAGESLVMFGSLNGAGFNEMLMAHCKILGFKPDITLEANNFAAVVGLTAAGLGVTILSRSLARFNVDTLVFRHIDMPFSSQLVMFHLSDASPTTRNFRRLIDERV